MTRSEARRYRTQIENSAVSASDETALEQKWMYPAWEVGKDCAVGDRVRHADKLYKCLQPHTSQAGWVPPLTPALWTEVSVEEWPEWRQPTGVQDAYNVGDKCSYKDKHWINTADANVYPPDVYGWEEVT